MSDQTHWQISSLGRTLQVALACFGALAVPAIAADSMEVPPDPFATAALVATGPSGALNQPCSGLPRDHALSLAEVVDGALCANPQTREAWANARYQAAQLGSAKSAWLPDLSATLSSSRNRSSGSAASVGRYGQSSLSLSASWLIYDFGGREAAIENARQLLAAANASQDVAVQSVFLAAVQGWSNWFATQAAVSAARESERASLESYKASERRYEVGTATPADRLQAKTAWSQAVLARIKAEGEERSARGSLMNVLGQPADAPVLIAVADDIHPARGFEADVRKLIELAGKSRPDLVAAEARVKAAEAAVGQAKAAGLPSISLSASAAESHSTVSDATRSDSIGVSVSVPLFTGYSSSYRIRAARAQLAASEAQRDRVENQVSLDVWQAYHGLVTATESVKASGDLLASATQSRKVAKGRYDAGLGGILDLLNAESALASARQQDVQARYAWLSARFALAQALGRLSLSDLARPSAAPSWDAK